MKNEERVIINQEADASIKYLTTGQVVPAEEFLEGYDIEKGQTGPIEGNNSTRFHPAELKLLRAIVHHPMRQSSEYAKLAGISPNTLLKIRAGLVERGFIRENKDETNNRGRAAIRLEPLESARQLVAKDGG
jgi:DNA-binding MarR family transcriptional regulator